MPRRSKVAALAALAAVGMILPLFGDPRLTPLTHALWARMLLRALDMNDAVKASARASTVFDTLSGRDSRLFAADDYQQADGIVETREGSLRRLSARDGVGEITYTVAVVQGGDYRLRAHVSGDPARPVTAEVAPLRGAAPPRTFRLVPGREPRWILGGAAHLDPGTYKASLLLPTGAGLDYLEVAPPCVNPVEPLGGWNATAVTSAEDLAVTALRALDMEDALAPADSPIERSGADFETGEAAAAAGEGFENNVLKAGRDGMEAMLVVDLPESGLYTLEAFVTPGDGQRWRADNCRKVVLCAGSPNGWRTVMNQSFSAGRHTFSVSLASGAALERIRLTRRKDSAADYVAALRRAGFDPTAGPVARPTALAAVEFVRSRRAERQALFCGDLPGRAAPGSDAPFAPGTSVAGAQAPTTGGTASGPGAPPPPTAPLSGALLPPQQIASPVLPGPS